MPQNDNTVVMEGVKLIFRNFTGRPGPYNKDGKKNFAVLLDEENARILSEDGWNVKYLQPREEDDIPQPYLPVNLHFGGFRPPRVVLITSRGRTNLDESQVEMLDWADIVNVDIIVRPYEWTQPDGRSGIAAYANSVYVTIDEDPLEMKYSELDQA